MKVFKHKKFVTLTQLEDFANVHDITVVNANAITDYTYHWILFYYEDVLGNFDIE